MTRAAKRKSLKSKLKRQGKSASSLEGKSVKQLEAMLKRGKSTKRKSAKRTVKKSKKRSTRARTMKTGWTSVGSGHWAKDYDAFISAAILKGGGRYWVTGIYGDDPNAQMALRDSTNLAGAKKIADNWARGMI